MFLERNRFMYIATREDNLEFALSYEEKFNANFYKIQRKEEYDKLNQNDLRYNDLVNNTTTWQDAIEAIKIKYPKPHV